MVATVARRPLVVICGQTATGKSSLAIELARHFDGEIICADSRTVYRGMNIATAKPTAAEQTLVPHWGLDMVDPDQPFTVADFKTCALYAMEDVYSRGKLPILVGGSGLYIDAVVYDFEFRAVASPQLHAELTGLNVEELQARVVSAGLGLPPNARNPRHLMRVIESDGYRPEPHSLRPDCLMLGLRADRDLLQTRIAERVEQMVVQGLVAEVQYLTERYGPGCQALQAPGYRAFLGYIQGTKTMEQAQADFIRNDMRYAKRQLTWFKRNKSIQWLSVSVSNQNNVDIATTIMNKFLS